MNGDWRLTNQINYLYMLKLKKEAFKKTDRSDHEHCEFCFGKFSENQGDLHFGYCTLDRYHWICDRCGALLKNLPEVISEATKVPVFIAQDPLDCVAIGTGESLKNIEVMRRSRK